MITSRKSVFETNSSSTHSISISSSTDVFSSITPDENGNIVLTGGEFGWENESYNDPLTKANYCALDYKNNKSKLGMLKKVILEHTGAKAVILNLDGYIDHQSAGTSEEAFESEEILKRFIFGKNSFLETSNDNDY